MKRYIKPNTEIVEVEITKHLLGGSLTVGDPDNANKAESRGGRGFWYDEEEEESIK